MTNKLVVKENSPAHTRQALALFILEIKRYAVDTCIFNAQ